MILEAAMVLASSVLFIGMGLSGEIQRIAGISLKILNCPKCLTFWSALAILLLNRHPVLPAVAVSFIASYLAMWLTLALDAATVKYTSLYEKITETPGASQAPGEDSASGSGADGQQADPDDEVPKMQIEL